MRVPNRVIVEILVLASAAMVLLWTLPRQAPQPEAAVEIQEQMRGVSDWASRPTEADRTIGGQAGSGAVDATEIATDGEGRIVEVAGLDARTVLRAYCNRTGAVFREPLEIASMVPPRPVCLGIFRDLADDGNRYYIQIRWDQTRRRWLAGDGVAAIRPARVKPGLASQIGVKVRF